MFQRGRQRRIIRQAARNAAAPGPHLQELNLANQMMASGRYQAALELYSRLALTAQSSGHPRQAANLHARAAEAAARLKRNEPCLRHARTALQGFQRMQMFARLNDFLNAIVTLLRSQGLPAEANLLQLEFIGQAEPLSTMSGEPVGRATRLPASCPQCGAPVRSDECEWIDAQSAECAYCGGVIQTD